MLTLLAQTATQPATQPGPDPLLQLIPWLFIGAIFWFLFFRPRAAEQKKTKQMLDALKKGDRVMTIGGIIGTVVNIKDDEVTLKIDESTNTKITIIRGAVKTIMHGEVGAKKEG